MPSWTNPSEVISGPFFFSSILKRMDQYLHFCSSLGPLFHFPQWVRNVAFAFYGRADWNLIIRNANTVDSSACPLCWPILLHHWLQLISCFSWFTHKPFKIYLHKIHLVLWRGVFSVYFQKSNRINIFSETEKVFCIEKPMMVDWTIKYGIIQLCWILYITFLWKIS